MTKILQLIETSGPGGAEKMLINHALELRKAGITSDVLLIKEGWLRGALEDQSFKCHVIELDRFLSTEWLRKVRTIIRQENYQALHGHEFAMNCHAAALGTLCNLPAVASVHGKNYYHQKLARRLLYRVSASRAHFVAVSEDIKSFLSTAVGIAGRKITVIPNGIDVSRFESSVRRGRETRSALGVSENDVLIGAIGNLYPVKGHIHLVRTAATMLRQRQDVQFFVAGRGGEEERLREEIRSLGLEKNFHLLGFREDVDNLLQAADIFVMPSLSEGMPLSILEAMAARTPIVASDTGGIPEVVKHEITGLLTPVADEEKLAENLLRLAQEPELRQRLAENAASIVNSRFSQANSSKRYIELYGL